MTYSEWRKYGYVSKLWELRAGPSQSVINTESQLAQSEIGQANQQNAIAQQENQLQQQNYQKMLDLQQPFQQQQTALASGNPAAVTAAAMPTISKISGGFQGAKESIMNSVPPGPARDALIAQLQTQGATAVGSTEAGLVQQAPGSLANLGSSYGAFSLQQLGAALSGLSSGTQSLNAASSANVNTGQLQTQRSAAIWSPFMALAGLAGQAVTGGLLGGAGGSGGGASPFMSYAQANPFNPAFGAQAPTPNYTGGFIPGSGVPSGTPSWLTPSAPPAYGVGGQ